MGSADRGCVEIVRETFGRAEWHGQETVPQRGKSPLEWLPSQPPFPLGMNPGTPVSTTALNLTRNLIPSLISRTASSGRVETSKFSLIRLGVFDVVRRADPRWMAHASKTCAGVLLTRLTIAVMTGSSSKLGSLLCPSAANACNTMLFFLQ